MIRTSSGWIDSDVRAWRDREGTDDSRFLGRKGLGECILFKPHKADLSRRVPPILTGYT